MVIRPLSLIDLSFYFGSQEIEQTGIHLKETLSSGCLLGIGDSVTLCDRVDKRLC